ncbi:MAG: ABC transporter substrate-binding protein [Paludibacteraceae bacterium]|nr:ABC transporter substrate-binding protein [Paludibacteraceae bacterium]
MKKRFLMVLAAAMVAVGGFAADRAHTLKVYNWADYIDMDNVLNSFPAWYKAQTGEEVNVIYQTFDINESMLTQIEVGKEDYDVVCPSEYIIERMYKQNLLQKIQKELIPDSINYLKNVAPFVLNEFQQLVPEGVDASDYTIGYMWGTTGWLYNPKALEDNDIDVSLLNSWGALTNPVFKNHIYVKDAFRDVYSVLVLYAYKDELAAGTVTKEGLMRDITEERVARVEAILKEAKDNIAGWEVDFGKEEMTKGKMWLNLSWSGDAQWAIDQAEEVGVKLDYVVPEEGSNVWFDGWVIPVYAKNPKAATYFINYMCKPENAIYNMEEIGYVSAVATPEIFEWASDDEAWPEAVDASYLFGDIAKNAHLNQVQYPDIAVIKKCALMHDAGEQTDLLLSMWNRVKGDNLSAGVMIFLILVVLCVIAYAIYILKKNNSHKTQRRRR